MSMAYLDPGNLTSDLQQGAYSNYQLIWVLWWSTVVGWVLQRLSSRLGVATGMNLAEHCREGYPSWVAWIIFLQMELAIIGADIQELLGSAIALNMLFGWQYWVGCVVTAFSTFGFLAIQKFGVRVLEAVFAFFIAVMGVCFIANWGASGTDSSAFMKGWVVPEVDSYAVVQAVGIIGAVIMPHNLYLHSGLVLSRKIDVDSPYKVREGSYYNSIESSMALFVSFWINVAIVCTFAEQLYDPTCATSSKSFAPFGCVDTKTLYATTAHGSNPRKNMYGKCSGWRGEFGGTDRVNADGHTNYQCASVGLDVAGQSLRTSVGTGFHYVWAVGLLCAGQAATTTATYAGQILMAGFFKIDLPMWVVMMVTRFCALGPAVVIALVASGNAGFQAQMNEWLNVLQSVQLPFALVPVLHFTSMPSVMGKHVNSPAMKTLCWLLAVLILGVNVYLVYDLLPFASTPLTITLTTLFVVLDYTFIAWLCKDDIKGFLKFLTGGACSSGDEEGNASLIAIDPKHRRTKEEIEKVDPEVADPLHAYS